MTFKKIKQAVANNVSHNPESSACDVSCPDLVSLLASIGTSPMFHITRYRE